MTDPRPIRVLIVDDDPMVIAGLELIVGSAPDIDVVGTATDGDEVIDAIHRHHPDVVLLDVRMKRQDGLVTTAAVNRLPHPPRIIVLTTWDTDDVVRRAIAGGAAGFLLKTANPADIVQAVRTVHAGAGVLSPDKVPYVFDVLNEGRSDRDAATAALSRLSARERDVAVEVARGLSNAQIGAKLYLGEATVKTHLANAQRKLGVGGRVGVAVLVTKAGLV